MGVLLTEITGPHQSGKSLIAMGALREAAVHNAIPCVVVCATQDMAHQYSRRFFKRYGPNRWLETGPHVAFISSHRVNSDSGVFAPARFVLFEDADLFDSALLQDNVKAASNWLNTCLGPTQILITRTVF